MKLKSLASLLLCVIALFVGAAALAQVDWVAVVTAKSPVYQSNSTSSKKLGTVNKNQILALQATKDNWAKVELNGKVGYMNAKALKKTTMEMFVKSATLPIYASNDTDSKKLATFVYGDSIELEAVSGSWARVVNGKNVGFCKYASLTDEDPNTMNLTVYVQKDNVTAYKAPATSSASLGKVKAGTKLVCTSIIGSDWCRVKNGNTVGFIQKRYLDTKAPKIEKEDNVTVYVQNDNVNVYAENSASSRVIGKVNAGKKLVMTNVSGSWCRVKNGDNVGYIQKTYLDTKAPEDLNTMKTTVYVQKNDVKVYSGPSATTSVIGTVGRNTKVTCLAILDDNWCRVKSGSNYGYIQKSYLDTRKNDGYSTATPASGKSSLADWWKSNIADLFAKRETAVVTDVYSGISFRVYRGGGTNHADVQPLTKEDTTALQKACGSDYNTWERRPIWVSVDGKKYAASMNCMPHGDGSISNNNYDGHFCIHFTNSRTHGTDSICSLHQAAVKKAYAAG